MHCRWQTIQNVLKDTHLGSKEKQVKHVIGLSFSLFLFSLYGCVSNLDESTTGTGQGDTSVLEAQLSGTAFDFITFTNSGTASVTSSGASFAGTVSPAPLAVVAAGQSDQYAETGIGNVTSFHIDYTSGSKKCHFDSASFPNTSGGCTFTKNAQSQGSTFATCTATVTGFDLTTCSQSVTFSMR